MSEQYPICEARLPSFGRVWATRVRSWCSSRTITCEKRAAGGSSPRPILSERPARTPTLNRVHRWPAQVPCDVELQHQDKLLVRAEEPQPGSHLISPRRGYVHHGIYVGDGKIVHYAGLARGQFRGQIEEVSLAQFAYGRGVWTRSSDMPEFVPQEVIRRARSRVGEDRYRILRNNCEHFCEWCLRGESRSFQVERLFSSNPARGLMLGIISLAASQFTVGVIGRFARSSHRKGRRPVSRAWAGCQKRLRPKQVLNFQAPDRSFAVNKALEIEVPRQTRLLSRGGLNVARLWCITLPPCR
jgi:hypothetical protein